MHAPLAAAALAALLVAAPLVAGCEGPPPEAYVAGANRAVRAADGRPAGQNRLGEACTQQGGGAEEELIYCGAWEQPSARLRTLAEGAGVPLRTLATAGAWRQTLDLRFDCGEPAAVSIATGEPALLLACTQRIGGWPHFALVTAAGGRAWLTDGVDAAEPVVERAIASATGRGGSVAATAGGADASQAARRLAAQPVRADDIQRYDSFMKAASDANRVGDPVAAELAYRRALTVQEQNLGRDNPAIVETLLGVALQVSTQGRFPEAEALFARAMPLVARGAARDRSLPARVLYYRALHTANLSESAQSVAEREAGTPTGAQAQAQAEALRAQAEALLAQADTQFAAALPNAQETQDAPSERPAQFGGRRDTSVRLRAPMTATDSNGIIGEVEERRYRSILLRDMGRPQDAARVLASARALAQANGVRALDVQARLTRVAARNSAALSRSGDAASGYGSAAQTFAAARRDLPRAETELRAAGQLMLEGRAGAALESCRTASVILRELRQGATSELMTPCLSAWAAQARGAGEAAGQALLREMFEAAQLVQSGTTSQQIAATTARLSEGSKDPRVGEAIRKREDVTRQLDRLARDRARAVAGGADAAALAAIDRKVAEQQEARAAADQAMQAASPGYFNLVQDIRPAAEVFAALHPGEVLVSIVDGPEEGWLMALRDGRIAVVAVAGGERRMAVLVRRIRDSVNPGEAAPPPFDAAAAREIYAATFGAIEPFLVGADRLVVAPTGALLSIPFGLLVTGPDPAPDAGKTVHPPYLIERLTVAHVPAPSSFVSLRRVAPSRASLPWIGFGDFRPPSLAQARATFPPERCGTAGAQLAQLELLPASRRELDLTRATLAARPADEILGDAFTSARALADGLQAYHVVHFSTHGIVANAIACQPEPAIITSTPAGAKDAATALLTASQVLDMHLDADAVILSACDTGASAEGGESLSGLARSFFSAGARALMVTQWELSEAVAPTLTAATFQQLGAHPELGLAGALRGVQLALIAKAANHEIPAAYGHPFLWAPLVVIGEGGGGPASVGGKTAAVARPAG